MLLKNKNIFFFLMTIIIFCLIHKGLSIASDNPLWQELGIYGGQVTSIEVDPDDPSVLYAGSWMGDGLFKSTDNGKTWNTIGWFRNYEVFDIAIDPNNSSAVWVANNCYLDASYDGGNSFRSFRMPDDRFCYAVAVDPHDPSGETVYAGLGGPDNTDYGGIIYMTRDGGETWFDAGLNADFNVRDIKINPDRTGEIWAICNKYNITEDGNIYLRAGESEPWYYWELNHFIDELIIHPALPDLIFVASQYGIYYKKDGPVPTFFYQSDETESYFARTLCIPPSDPSVVYSGIVDGSETSIFASFDFGESWDYVSDSPDEFICMKADPAKASVLYAGGINGGVFKSEDSAKNWSTSNTGIKANTIYSSDISLSPLSVVCGSVAGIFISEDNFKWDLINSDSTYFVLFSPESNETIYAGQTWNIAKTTDRGNSWSYRSVSGRTDSHNVYSIAIDPINTDTVYAGIAYSSANKRGEVIKLIDNGASFYNASKSILLETDAPVNTVVTDTANPDRILVGTGAFFAPIIAGGIYISQDSGKTWKKTLDGVVVNKVTVDPVNSQVIYAGCGASNNSFTGIYKSSDGGNNWQLIDKGLPDNYSVKDIRTTTLSSDILYAALYKGFNDEMPDKLNGIYISLNGGDYWTQIGLSDYRLHDVKVYLDENSDHGQKTLSVNSNDINLPKGTVIAGTASGLYRTNTAGTGVIYGNVVSQDTGENIDRALISSDLGSNTISDKGLYLMLASAGVHCLNIQASGYQGSNFPGVTVGAGSSVNLDIVLKPSSNGDPCLFSKILSKPAEKPMLDFFRTFRDGYLQKFGQGRQLVAFYYKSGKNFRVAMEKNPVLLRQGLGILYESIPVFGKLILDNSYTVPVSFRNKTDGFLFNVQQQLSDEELKNRIKTIRLELKRGLTKN